MLTGSNHKTDKLFVLKQSKVDTTECIAFVILILNLLTGCIGTLLSALVDKKGLNTMGLLVFLLQLLSMPLVIGYIWGIIHAYAIYHRNIGNK